VVFFFFWLVDLRRLDGPITTWQVRNSQEVGRQVRHHSIPAFDYAPSLDAFGPRDIDACTMINMKRGDLPAASAYPPRVIIGVTLLME